jgi:hypothetical protein
VLWCFLWMSLWITYAVKLLNCLMVITCMMDIMCTVVYLCDSVCCTLNDFVYKWLYVLFRFMGVFVYVGF